ncbi:hypothetical protein EC396_13570 [Lutibacter sp. HS1-25]|uniref:GIN domain-containing protein n=1 Tax=Lutibacter sp. HS1-25 TaxID=2485000 RepID=UPI001012B585|nr:DUF2807 domain-containing protein [Lutibacter sp. HS1-25]RXP46551.1 hypothetical protein EC396_13570 [Lutibacter sp. HS1-25]
MKISYKIAFIFTLFATTTIISQEKLKGNGEVTTENRDISDFTKIEIIDDIEVFLVHNKKQSVSIEADVNLQNNILTKVKDGVLTIRTDQVIGRSKALKVHLDIDKNITEISTYNKVNVTSKNLIIIDSISFNAYDSSVIKLKLNTKSIAINGKSGSNLDLEILTNNATIETSGSNTTTAVINAQNVALKLADKSTVNFSGTTDNLDLSAFSSTTFKGKSLATKSATVKAYNSAEILVNVSENLNIFSNNSSEITIYSNPKITITEFFDKAILRKKELN